MSKSQDQFNVSKKIQSNSNSNSNSEFEQVENIKIFRARLQS